MNSTNYTNNMLTVIGRNDQLLRNASRVGSMLTRTVTLPLTIMGSTAVYEFGKFDRAMAESLSIMGNVGPELRSQMEETAKVLSTKGVTAADTLGKSYYYLAQSGMSAEEAMNSLNVVNQFAIAGMFDQAKATDLLTDAQMALGLVVRGQAEATAANMQWVGDVLVKASTLANASTEQFADALTTKSAAAMRFFNIEVEEGVAVLAAYSDMGKKGNEAGNMYDRALRLMAKSVLTASDAHKQLGFEVYNTADGSMKPMAEIVDNLDGIMAGLSDRQRAATLSMLGFEARSQQAITPLLGMGDAIRGYEEKLRSVTGFTDEVARKAQQGFVAQMVVLWNRVKVVAIELGEKLAPALTLVAKIFVGMLETVAALPAPLQYVILAVGGLAAAMGPLITAVSLATVAYHALNLVLIRYVGHVGAGVAMNAAFATSMRLLQVGMAVGLALAVRTVLIELIGMNEALEEANRLHNQLMSTTQRRMNREAKAIEDITDRQKKQVAIEEKMAEIKRNIMDVEAAKRKALDVANGNFPLMGDDPRLSDGMTRNAAKQALAEVDARLQAYKSYYERLEEMQKENEEKMKQPVNQATLDRLKGMGMPQDIIDSMDPGKLDEWEKEQSQLLKDKAREAKGFADEQKRLNEEARRDMDKAVKDQERLNEQLNDLEFKHEQAKRSKAQKDLENLTREKNSMEKRFQSELERLKMGDAQSFRSGRGALLDLMLSSPAVTTNQTALVSDLVKQKKDAAEAARREREERHLKAQGQAMFDKVDPNLIFNKAAREMKRLQTEQQGDRQIGLLQDISNKLEPGPMVNANLAGGGGW